MSPNRRSCLGENVMTVTTSFAYSFLLCPLHSNVMNVHDSEWNESWAERPGFS